MSFYILIKEQLIQYDFDYLTDGNRDHKWDKTKPRSQCMNEYLEENSDRRSKVKELYANQLMSSPVYFLELDAKLPVAKKLMGKFGVNHIPITKNGEPVGIISDRDLIKLEKTGTFSYLCVEEVMSTLMVCSSSQSSLSEVAEVFVKEKINAMPIVDEKLAIIGIVSSRDILRAVVEHKFLLK